MVFVTTPGAGLHKQIRWGFDENFTAIDYRVSCWVLFLKCTGQSCSYLYHRWCPINSLRWWYINEIQVMKYLETSPVEMWNLSARSLTWRLSHSLPRWERTDSRVKLPCSYIYELFFAHCHPSMLTGVQNALTSMSCFLPTVTPVC